MQTADQPETVTPAPATSAEIRRFGTRPLDDSSQRALAGVTERLLADSPDSVAEYRRYISIRQRGITVAEQPLRDLLTGRTVLVTGHSGCIGSALIRELVRYKPGRLVGVSLDPEEKPTPGVQHHTLDIRDCAALTALIGEVVPDIVFHLAAQRDPGLAEHAVQRTITTNVLGTCNVVAACESAGVPRLVYASTGKALRPYTNCVYASSKRVSERIVGDSVARGAIHGAAVRFTHVVDNAILLQRLQRWCEETDVIRLHSLDTAFYIQSALESAQLLLIAAVSPPDDVFRLHAIRDLGWPVRLLALALGAVAESGRRVPIQEIGHEPGYERIPYPGLYDPAQSWKVSPLLNGMEAASVERSASPDVDAARHNPRLTEDLTQRIESIERLTRDEVSPAHLRARFDDLARADLEQTVRDTQVDVLQRIVRITEPHRPGMSDEHRHIDDAIRHRLTQAAPA